MNRVDENHKIHQNRHRLMEVEEEREEKQNQWKERLIELQGEMEGQDLQKIDHPSHPHPLELRESLQSHGGCYGGGGHQVKCNGCREPISSSSSPSSGVWGGGGALYACPNSDCLFLLHKRCAKLPHKIEHPSHPKHALTLFPFPLYKQICAVCTSIIDGFVYRCSSCYFHVHVRCASMVLSIQERVNENKKIHQHWLIPLEMEAQFLCAACDREHKGKSYLCPSCGFWANQICTSAPTTVNLHRHPHPLVLFRSDFGYSGNCKICNEEVKRAYWAYVCSEGCKYSVHLSCLPSEEVENPNEDIQTNFHSKSTSHEIEKPTGPKEECGIITLPVLDESVELMTELIKKLSFQGRHKRVIKIPRCKKDHQLISVDKKIDEFKDNQLCDGCAQTISSQFYHCAQCNLSLHEWCAKLPNKFRHILHPEHALHLLTQQELYFSRTYCLSCDMPTNGFVFGCLICKFYLDLKCASLPGVIKHQVHDHNLALRRVTSRHSCNACGVVCFECFTVFQCEACNFTLCIKCAFLPSSVEHRYDKHPFALTYSPDKGQFDEYYCEICEEDINSMFWFYHCGECDQSIHPECIYPIELSMNVKFGVRFEVGFHFHLLSCVRYPTGGRAFCHECGCRFRKVDCVAYKCEQCDFLVNARCLKYCNHSEHLPQRLQTKILHWRLAGLAATHFLSL